MRSNKQPPYWVVSLQSSQLLTSFQLPKRWVNHQSILYIIFAFTEYVAIVAEWGELMVNDVD
jgi:hypothetical protein